MAQVAYTPIPEVSANGPVQNLQMNVRANPADFGGLVGEAEQRAAGQIGQGGQDMIQAGMARRDLTNEIWANDANTAAMKQMTDAWSGYNKLEGRAAQDALPKFQDQVNSIYADALSKAPSLQTQAMLSRTTRQMADWYLKSGQNYADQQWKSWQDKSALDGSKAFYSQAALAVNDPKAMDTFLNSGDDQIRKLGEQKGYDKQTTDVMVSQGRGAAVKDIVSQKVLDGDAVGAKAILDKYSDQMDAASRLDANRVIHGHLRAIDAQQEADDTLAKLGLGGAAGQPSQSAPNVSDHGNTGQGGSGVSGSSAPKSGAPTVDPYANIPKTDSLGQDQIAKFRKWNPDPVGNNAANMASLDPSLSSVVQRAQEIAGTKFVVGSGRRDADQQKMAIDFGWSKTEDSDHLSGRAVDLWPVDDKGHVVFDPQKQTQIISAMKQAAQEKGISIEAGADFKKEKDLPHFQLGGSVPSSAPSPQSSAGVASHVSALTGSMGSYANAISSIESGGNYQALGPETKNGDRAYGKYQVMGNNIPAWTQAALGHSLTPQQFLHDPAAQDAVFEHRFGGYVQQYGNPQDAASAWFTGRPLAQGGNAKDVLGTTGNAYVDKFNKALGQSGGGANGAAAGTGPTQQPSAQFGAPIGGIPAPVTSTASPNVTQTHEQKADIYQDKADAISAIRTKYANDPEMADAIIARVNQGITVSMLNQKAAQEQALAAQDTAFNKYYTAAMKGDVPASQLTQMIASDNTLTGQTKEHLNNAIQTIGQGKALGSNFYDFFRRIHSNGPDKITSPDQLLQAVDGQSLTFDGANKLREELNGAKTIDADATAEMKKGALAYIKHNLSFEADYGTFKIPDPAGEDIFNSKAIPAFYSALDAGMKAGKTPYQLLTAGSPDYIGDKIISTFKRTPAQEMKDKIAAGDNSMGNTPAAPSASAVPPATSFDLSAPTGVVAAYKAGSISRVDANNRLNAFRAATTNNQVPNN